MAKREVNTPSSGESLSPERGLATTPGSQWFCDSQGEWMDGSAMAETDGLEQAQREGDVLRLSSRT